MNEFFSRSFKMPVLYQSSLLVPVDHKLCCLSKEFSYTCFSKAITTAKNC